MPHENSNFFALQHIYNTSFFAVQTVPQQKLLLPIEKRHNETEES